MDFLQRKPGFQHIHTEFFQSSQINRSAMKAGAAANMGEIEKTSNMNTMSLWWRSFLSSACQ